ncbi:hypothetical protein ACRAWF_17510 [Streptomyces sp. L7]
MEELRRGLLLVDHGGQLSAHGRDELWCEAHSGVVVLDGFLDLFDRDVRQFTNVVEAAVAEEVPIDVAVPVGGVLDDHVRRCSPRRRRQEPQNSEPFSSW